MKDAVARGDKQVLESLVVSSIEFLTAEELALVVVAVMEVIDHTVMTEEYWYLLYREDQEEGNEYGRMWNFAAGSTATCLAD